MGRRSRGLGNLYVRDTRDGALYEVVNWMEDIDLPLFETTEFTLRHWLTDEEIIGSPELLETYFTGLTEMEVLAWAAQ